MEYIRDTEGNIIQTSHNLRGIRRYVKDNLISSVSLYSMSNDRGYIYIRFDNGALFETEFASYSVLLQTVRNWRNIYGADLFVNASYCGPVSRHNASLVG